MKKHLKLILIGLIALVLVPSAASAASLKYSWDEVQAKQTRTGGKVETTKTLIINSETAYNKELKFDIKFTANDAGSTIKFTANTSVATAVKKEGEEDTYTVTVKNLVSGENKIGAYIITAIDENGIDCGGTFSPSKALEEGTQTTGDDTESNDNTETGYGIPYIALAVGTVGTITVLATSKKKNKFYKI